LEKRPISRISVLLLLVLAVMITCGAMCVQIRCASMSLLNLSSTVSNTPYTLLSSSGVNPGAAWRAASICTCPVVIVFVHVTASKQSAKRQKIQARFCLMSLSHNYYYDYTRYRCNKL